jgi:hypothetical protein
MPGVLMKLILRKNADRQQAGSPHGHRREFALALLACHSVHQLPGANRTQERQQQHCRPKGRKAQQQNHTGTKTQAAMIRFFIFSSFNL